MSIFVNCVNWLISKFAFGLHLVLQLLPKSPKFDNAIPNNVHLENIVWVIPFPTMLLHFMAILGCIGIYYVVRVLARWLKVVRS